MLQLGRRTHEATHRVIGTQKVRCKTAANIWDNSQGPRSLRHNVKKAFHATEDTFRLKFDVRSFVQEIV